MKRPSVLVTGLSGLVAGTAALAGLALGTGPAMPVFLVVALLAAAVAVWSWQSTQPIGDDRRAARSWWKVLLAGPALAAITFGAMAIPWPDAMDLGDNAYWLVMVALMTSLTLAATGVILGIVAVADCQRTRRGPSPA